MDSEVETIEERLDSLLGQLQSECAILERIVYKNKNQHRRCSYFQYLLKVRRDLRLLQSTKLEEILSSCFHVITGKRPKQKVHLLESLKRRKCGGTFNFMERLLGAARLLSQMVEPMLQAATEISTLLARSFFMGFSLTILSLLARLRVLAQQILLDVVIVFNMVSILSQKKQSIKITQEGIEVFREFYPTNEDSVTLECVWKTDKFVLLEKIHKSKIYSQDGNLGGDVSLGSSAVHYQCIESFLGDDALGSKKPDTDSDAIGGPTQVIEDSTDLFGSPSIEGGSGKIVEGCIKVGDDSGLAASPGNKISQEGDLLATSSSSASSNSLRLKSGSRKVAFVSVQRPGPSTKNVADLRLKETDTNSDDKEDPFFSLLTGGNLKDSLF